MSESSMELKVVAVEIPEPLNVVFGQTHFIKTVEDLYEALVSTSPALRFGIAFCEASQERLVRTDGNDDEMIRLATKAAMDVGCGHSFFIYMKDGFPINVLNRIQQVQEVVGTFCATANPLQVVVAETELGRGVMGVIDGQTPAGVENEDHKRARMDFLRTIGYKRG